jgi:hypothetical protein
MHVGVIHSIIQYHDMNYFKKYEDLISDLPCRKLWANKDFNNFFISSLGLVQKLFCMHSQTYPLPIKHLLFTELSPSKLVVLSP